MTRRPLSLPHTQPRWWHWTLIAAGCALTLLVMAGAPPLPAPASTPSTGAAR